VPIYFSMPVQRLFTKQDQRTFANTTVESAVTQVSDFLRQARFYINFTAPTQIHAEQYFYKLGLKRVMDVEATRSPHGTTVSVKLSATLGDDAAVVGLIGAVVILPVAVAVGAISYIDYENDANALMASLWNYLGSTAAGTVVRCGNCGLNVDVGDRFCRRCGSQL